ncbi:MAG: AAA family ATPase [Piscirickettsiaceae bacterium]|nr:AAA family ATPase [Piscirickettsiaceae bacterium]
MTEFEASSTEPSYISRLALQSAPFSIATKLDTYYSSSQLEHRLNLLLHLVRSSSKIALLVADDGLGKTTLLTQLQNQVGEELKTFNLDGQMQFNTDATLVLCLQQLGVDEGEIQASDNLSDTFRNRLKQLGKLNIRPLLLVDNAQALSEGSLATLSTWFDWQNNEDYLLQAVIASKSEISLANSVQPRIQKVDLPAMEQQELSAYLMFRLTRVGYQGENPFSDKDVQQFYRLSSGNPELINQLAHQQLLGLKPVASSSMSFDFSSLRAGMRWIGVGILIVLLVLLLRYQDQLNSWLTPLSSDNEVMEQSVIDMAEDVEPAMVIVENDDIKTNEQAERDELTSLLSEIEQIGLILKQKEPQDIEEPLEAKQRIVEDATILTQEIYHQDWILQQQGSDYTFQLMGSWEKQEVSDFIEKYSLTGDVATFESTRNGRVWYAVIYGVFDSKQVALTASGNWPAPLNTLPSWLRRFDSVHKQIKSMAPVQQ